MLPHWFPLFNRCLIGVIALWTYPLKGASFTWFRDSGSVCMLRIDRTLALMDWVDHFGNVSQRVLPRVVSDHCPLLVVVGNVNKGRSAFKFENMWLKEEGFVERVRQW